MSHKISLAFILTAAATTTPSNGSLCDSTHSHDTRLSSGSCRHKSPLSSFFSQGEPTMRRSSPRHHHSHGLSCSQADVALQNALGRPLTAYLRCGDDAPRVNRVRVRPLSQHLEQRLKSPIAATLRALEGKERKQFKNEKHEPSSRKSSKFCMVDGCTSRAKHSRRCWKHGGSVKCKVADCVNRAKSKGVCWSHGGGSPCSVGDCDTIAVSNGYCWAHGGGKRCSERGCSRPAYERTRNLCAQHYEEVQASPGSSDRIRVVMKPAA